MSLLTSTQGMLFYWQKMWQIFIFILHFFPLPSTEWEFFSQRVFNLHFSLNDLTATNVDNFFFPSCEMNYWLLHVASSNHPLTLCSRFPSCWATWYIDALSKYEILQHCSAHFIFTFYGNTEVFCQNEIVLRNKH